MIHVCRFLFGVFYLISLSVVLAGFFAGVWLIFHFWVEAIVIYLVIAAYFIGKEWI